MQQSPHIHLPKAGAARRRPLSLAGRCRQGGQAILWFLVTSAACCAVLALVYNVGQVTNEKEKTVNAADAAALSGALVEARMLNFMAYSNRAMITNEETIAQILSLDSWVRFNANLAEHASDIPIVGVFIEPYAAALDTAQYAAIDPLAEIGIPAADKLVKVLAAARDVANSVAVVAANQVAGNIAQANVTIFEDTTTGNARADSTPTTLALTTMALNQTAWSDFSQVYSGSDRGNAAQVVLDSRDGFTRKRGMGVVFDLLNNLPAAVTGIEKTSDTTNLRDYDHWEASDSADIWVGVTISIFGHTIDVAKVDTLPVGWGRADTNQDGDEGKDWDWGKGPCKQYIALGCEMAYASINAVSGWSGIPEIRDLKNAGKGNDNDTLTFVAAVKKAAQEPLTTQRIGTGMNDAHLTGVLGSPDLKDNLQGNADQIAGIAAARIFFSRPDWNKADRTAGKLPRSDKAHEYASLYNPYWEARLTDPNKVKYKGVSATTALYAALGLPGLNCAADTQSCLP